MNLPEGGEYGLEIYANDPLKDGDMFTHVCQYLVTYTERNLEDIYGTISNEKPTRTERDRGRSKDGQIWYIPSAKTSELEVNGDDGL